ncbi:protein kinase [Enterobacter asburiae]|uniref:protein kinase n=1 Tax=Enterobacter asburiae TaxID=61645 RepID=UPI001FF5DA35|nr:protein kinase [Enterobacter asburiae]UOZ19243.1 protein kinase [Enterobacter asburiae]
MLLKDFKEWLIKTFPNEKPKLIFDDIERNTHSSITVEVYQTLLADRDHLQVRINKAEEVFREQKRRIESLEGENASLKNMVEKGVGGMDGRSERSYLNVIGGLISIMLSKSPGGQRYSIFDNQSAIIQTLLGHYVGKYGISDTNLEKKFAEANRSIRE